MWFSLFCKTQKKTFFFSFFPVGSKAVLDPADFQCMDENSWNLTWLWVNNDRFLFYFGWTIHLRLNYFVLREPWSVKHAYCWIMGKEIFSQSDIDLNWSVSFLRYPSLLLSLRDRCLSLVGQLCVCAHSLHSLWNLKPP